MLQFLKNIIKRKENPKYNITRLNFSKSGKRVLKQEFSVKRNIPFFKFAKTLSTSKVKISFKYITSQCKKIKSNILKNSKKQAFLIRREAPFLWKKASANSDRAIKQIAPALKKSSVKLVYLSKALVSSISDFKNMSYRAKRNICTVAALIILVIVTAIGTVGYEISINGKYEGMIRDKKLVQDKINSIKDKSRKQYNVKISIPSKIKYKKVMFAFKRSLSADEIDGILERNLSVMADAYAINVNGMDIAYLKDRTSAEAVLEKLKEPYLKDVTQTENIGFLEEVKIVERDIMAINIEGQDSVYKRLAEGSQGERKYVVKAGDTISEIAEEFHVKLEDVRKANPGINIERIQIGQEINLSIPRFAINITETKVATYEEKVPYEVKYEKSASLYKGQERVKVSGKEGKKTVKAELVEVNGIVEKKIVLQEELVQTPKTQVVLKGTKERPRTIAYGIFTRPSSGGVTSRYGMRWGRLHTGVDLGASTGSPIKASDGGKVIFSGWKGAYGKLIIIDHENGYVTYYGHCSKLYVNTGERVARGEVIAAVGSTGRVTGPHLHFEVRKNGTPVNPLNFIN